MNWQTARQQKSVKAPRSELALAVGALFLVSASPVMAEEAASNPSTQRLGQVIEVLDDQRLGGIRGKFVAGGANTSDAVILWDERPGGFGDKGGGTGGGQKNHHSQRQHSQGLGNDQITNVTTERNH